MKILSWNVNGVQARQEAVNRLVAELQPDLMCFQKVRKKGAFLTNIPGYFGWLGIMDDRLFGGVSTYIGRKMPFDFEAQRNDMPEWLMETGCLNVIRFDQFIQEALKGLFERVREISCIYGKDGAELVDLVLSAKAPIMQINRFQTDSEISEHKGFGAMLKTGAVIGDIAAWTWEKLAMMFMRVSKIWARYDIQSTIKINNHNHG